MADFFEKLKSEISSNAAVISMKSKTLFEVNKLKGQISTLEKQKQGHLMELGTHYYTFFSKGGLQDSQGQYILDTVCNVIVEIDRQIKGIENTVLQFQEAEKEMQNRLVQQTCNCGELLNSNTIFCKKCGTKVEDMLQKQTEGCSQSAYPNLPKCTCGAALKLETKFCGVCGSKVKPENAQSVENMEETGTL